jgi:coenzyme F420-dependent glucose-6-phosphate dehydrogenase
VDIQARAEEQVTIDEVLEQWTVSVEPRVHREAIEELAALGATHVVVHVASPNQKEVIDFFGRKVLPALRVVS